MSDATETVAVFATSIVAMVLAITWTAVLPVVGLLYFCGCLK